MSSSTPPIVIIGSGMAGYTLVREFRKLDTTTAVTIITQDNGANYAKPTLSNALAAGKTADKIALGDAQKMRDTLNADILTDTQVLSIDANNRSLTLKNASGEQTLSYAKLVLAVGAKPIDLTFEGDAAGRVLQVNNLDDYSAFRTQLDQKGGSHVLIIGAGLIGCEFANDLAGAGHSATVVDLAAQPLNGLLPAELAEAFTKQLENLGVTFVFGTSVQAVNQGENTSLRATLQNGEVLNADMVLSAVGLRPSIALAKNTGLAVNRGIVVDTHLQTSAPDIYAIGDCAEVGGHVLPYVMPLMNEARALAKTLAGEATQVAYPAMPVGVKTPAAPLVVLPPPKDAQTQWSLEPTEDGMIAKACSGDGELRGFALLGKTAGKERLTLTKQIPDLL